MPGRRALQPHRRTCTTSFLLAVPPLSPYRHCTLVPPGRELVSLGTSGGPRVHHGDGHLHSDAWEDRRACDMGEKERRAVAWGHEGGGRVGGSAWRRAGRRRHGEEIQRSVVRPR
ncbi:hypothetical protein BS78_01G220400 [Paspalum vaginatum]|nr:hypothetical protein BS78_01G220400 [Paspalum vaginatum]